MTMDATFQQALLGTLSSPEPQPANDFGISFRNTLASPISVFWLDPSGRRSFVCGVRPSGASVVEIQAQPGDYFIATCGLTGAFVGVVTIAEKSADNSYVFSAGSLTAPFDIGPLPVSTADTPIPGDSPAVVVGSGQLNNRNIVIRTQCWQRSPDSFCLAPGETRQVTLTITEGRQDTSSDVESATSSVSASASAGWGPFSASVSASLTTTSTHSQSMTVQAQTSRFVSEALTNTQTATQLYLKWSLLDVVSIFDAGDAPLSSLVQTLAPTLVSISTYPPPARAAALSRPEMPGERLAQLPDYKRLAYV